MPRLMGNSSLGIRDIVQGELAYEVCAFGLGFSRNLYL